MLGLSELKQTKVYQESFAEGEQIGEHRGELKAKLEAIPRMIEFGLSWEQIAQLQDLPLEAVQQAAQLFYEQNVAAFIELLNPQRELFSSQDLADLARLIDPLPDNIADFSSPASSASPAPPVPPALVYICSHRDAPGGRGRGKGDRTSPQRSQRGTGFGLIPLVDSSRSDSLEVAYVGKTASEIL
ncbi:MAG: hypothetical protein Fur006_61130 [Coleofasciculaceae cyanobacterium]